jgi:WD40 repeat protein
MAREYDEPAGRVRSDVMRRIALAAVLAACGARSGPGVSAEGAAPAGAAGDALPAGADLRLGDPRWRVPGAVDALAFSADERFVLVASRAGGAIAIEAASGARRVRVADLGMPGSVAALGDGHAIVAGDIERTPGGEEAGPGPPTVIELATGAIDHRPRLARLVAAEVAVVPGGGGLVLRSDAERPLTVVGGNGERLHDLDRSRGYERIAVSASGEALAVRPGRTAAIWELRTGHRRAVFAVGAAGIAALSADGALVATGDWGDPRGGDSLLDVYRVTDGERVGTIAAPCITGAAFAPGGEQIAVVCTDATAVYAVPSGRRIAELPAAGVGPTPIAWSASGRWLAYGGGNAVHVIDTATWREVSAGAGRAGAVRALVTAPDGRIAADGSDERIELWTAAGVLDRAIEARGVVQTFAFAGADLLVGRRDDFSVGALVERDAGPGAAEPSRRFRIEIGDGGDVPHVTALRGRRDGELAVATSTTVRVLAPRAAKTTANDAGGASAATADSYVEAWRYGVLEQLDDHDDVIHPPAAFSRDGSRGAIATAPSELTIVDLDLQATSAVVRIAACGAFERLAFTGDRDRLLASDAAGRLYRVDVVQHRAVGTIGEVALGGPPTVLAWMPSGDALALGGSELVIWNRDGALAAVTVPDATAIAPTPDGRHLLVGQTDGTIVRYRWDALRDRARPVETRRAAGCPPVPPAHVEPAPPAQPPRRGRLDNADPHEGDADS